MTPFFACCVFHQPKLARVRGISHYPCLLCSTSAEFCFEVHWFATSYATFHFHFDLAIAEDQFCFALGSSWQTGMCSIGEQVGRARLTSLTAGAISFLSASLSGRCVFPRSKFLKWNSLPSDQLVKGVEFGQRYPSPHFTFTSRSLYSPIPKSPLFGWATRFPSARPYSSTGCPLFRAQRPYTTTWTCALYWSAPDFIFLGFRWRDLTSRTPSWQIGSHGLGSKCLQSAQQPPEFSIRPTGFVDQYPP